MKLRSSIAVLGLALPTLVTACVPEPPPPPDPWQAAAGSCWQSPPPYFAADLEYFGPRNTFGNAAYNFSNDGSCTNPYFVQTVVQASNAAEAGSVCASLGVTTPSPAPVGPPGVWANAAIPVDAWVCVY